MKRIVLITLLYLSTSISVDANGFAATKAMAERGDAFAQFRLGVFYEIGHGGVLRDYAEASRWYLKAAEQGNKMAQLDLARMFVDGKGVQQNYVEAGAWLILLKITTKRPRRRGEKRLPEGAPDNRPIAGVVSQANKYRGITFSKLSDGDLVKACMRSVRLFGLMLMAPGDTRGSQGMDETCRFYATQVRQGSMDLLRE